MSLVCCASGLRPPSTSFRVDRVEGSVVVSAEEWSNLGFVERNSRVWVSEAVVDPDQVVHRATAVMTTRRAVNDLEAGRASLRCHSVADVANF